MRIGLNYGLSWLQVKLVLSQLYRVRGLRPSLLAGVYRIELWLKLATGDASAKPVIIELGGSGLAS